MKKTLIFLIDLYQLLIVGLLNQILGTSKICRHEKSCSEYAKEQINKKGVIKGVRFAALRLLTCHPFGKIYK